MPSRAALGAAGGLQALWLLVAGASVIDPPSPDLATSRIDALPLPRLALSRRDLTHARLDLTIDAGRAEPKPDLAGSLAS